MLILFTVAMPPHTRPNIVCLPLKDTYTYDIHDHAHSLFTSESSVTVSELKVDYKYIIINLVISPYCSQGIGYGQSVMKCVVNKFGTLLPKGGSQIVVDGRDKNDSNMCMYSWL